jgi:hypothetical protein
MPPVRALLDKSRTAGDEIIPMHNESIAHDILLLLRLSNMSFNNNPIDIGMDLVILLADIESSVSYLSLLTLAGRLPKSLLLCTINNHSPDGAGEVVILHINSRYV